MKKFVLFVIILIIFVFIIPGCSEDNMKSNSVFKDDRSMESMPISKDNSSTECITISKKGNIRDLITHIYSDQEMDCIMEFRGTLEELNELYPVECYRKKDNDYVVFLSTSNIGIVYFRDNLISYSVKLSPNYNCKEYEVIKIGWPISSVMDFDSNGEFFFLYSGVNLPRISTHYTNDGFVVKIHYDEIGNVSAIMVEEL